VKTKPQLILLASSQGQNNNSTLSQIQWDMAEKVHVLDSNHTGMISLKSMHFVNSFANIISGKNKLKILSTYTESGVYKENLIEVTVPVGHYNLTSLLAYLNTDGVCNSLSTYYYGMGDSGDVANYPPFSVSSSDSAKISFHPPTGGSGVLAYNILHVYTGFFLVVDADTSPLLLQLGLLRSSQPGIIENLTNSFSTKYPHVIGTSVLWDGAVAYNYPTANTVTTTGVEVFSSSNFNVIDLAGPKALMIQIQELHANVRTSISDFSTGNTIAVVPVSSAYGGVISYQPDRPFENVTPNLQLNSFTINIKDASTGDRVDFQGANWIATLLIEFYEIENKTLSETGESGEKNNIMPIYHGLLANHNLPNSGADEHGIVGKNQLRSIKRRFN